MPGDLDVTYDTMLLRSGTLRDSGWEVAQIACFVAKAAGPHALTATRACEKKSSSSDRRSHARRDENHPLWPRILAILAPLAAMTYFLFKPDAFNAFTDWLFRVL
jgi:hypothetical protein